ASTGRPVRVVCEPRPGVAHARTRGLDAATGDVVLFIDDDVRVQPGWYEAMTAAMDAPDVGAAGGTILPAWPDGRRPSWLPRSLATYYAERHAGLAVRHLPFGANMSLDRAAALEAGGFRADL